MATDSSGQDNNGTLTNGPVWQLNGGHINGALSFDGVDDYVAVPGTVYATQNASFSFSAWVNLTDFSNSSPDIMQIKSDTASPWHVLLSNNESYLGISVGSSSTWATIKTNNVPSLGAWHHIVVTYNGNDPSTIGNFQIFLDGVSQTLSSAGGYSDQAQNNKIGAAQTSANQWKGLIDDVRIYNRALTAADVTALYHYDGRQN